MDNAKLEADAEAFVRKCLKPGTDEATIKAVTAKVAKATARTLSVLRKE